MFETVLPLTVPTVFVSIASLKTTLNTSPCVSPTAPLSVNSMREISPACEEASVICATSDAIAFPLESFTSPEVAHIVSPD